MKYKVFTSLILFMTLNYCVSLQYDCSKIQYERCIKMADPLVKEVQFIFPDNINDVDLVCRTWNNFVDCLKKYTERCFSNQQRHQFNKAVEMPIASVHQMCTQPQYQKEYLRYAPCMKKTVVKNGQCGPHYNLLVEQVNQGDVISKATLCCSHYRFKQCVVQEIRKMCDRGVPNGPATTFSTQIIDKALSFLQEQCHNYVYRPNSGDCSHFRSDTYTDTAMMSTLPSQVYRWNNLGDVAAKEIIPTAKPITTHSVATSWLPSSDTSEIPSSIYSQYETTSSIPVPALGSRSRPASYGRASGWFNQGANTPKPDLPPVRASGATISSWTVVNPSSDLEASNEPQNKFNTDSPFSSSTTWYPAAGNQLSNEVDEPNQMGLVKPDSSANSLLINNFIWPSFYIILKVFSCIH